MNEWGFAAEVKSWWDVEFADHPEWGLRRCEVERQSEESTKRSDLVVHGGGGILLSGELRLPDHPRASPWDPENLVGAVEKALTHGARWAFTSDATSLLLVDTQRSGPSQTRVVHRVELAPFERRDQLESEAFLEECKGAWLDAIREVAPIVLGRSAAPGMSPDEVFVGSLRALLRAPVAAIRDELDRRRRDDALFEQRLVGWMVDEQGWTHLPERWHEEVDRVARLTAYVFTTRLMFYEALRRPHPTLAPLELPESVAGADLARRIVGAYFDAARAESGDYETLFTWDRAAEYALLADAAVPSWRRVLEHLRVFDLARVGYDVIGKLFERLIEPHERYRWGQHYTNPDVCDLMLSFALPDGEGAMLDPACGGGTFLVRAYARKRALLPPSTPHQELLAELYGADVSAFAASLAAVNLAVRDLSFADNYPQVVPASFFALSPAKRFMALPAPEALGLGTEALVPVNIDAVRAVVCNPPYVRLHELGEERAREAQGVLAHPAGRVPVPGRLSRLANYHVYFWLHAAQFLEPEGRLAFITAGEWMDSDYGAALQEWLLKHFAIECCVESVAEPWFSEARVGTVITVARLCDDERERADNLVRFALLRRPLQELFGPAASDREHFANVDRLRDRLLSLEEPVGEGSDFDWSVVRQGDLYSLGIMEGA